MEVSECDIIEGIKNLRTDVVKSADGEFLRFTGTCTGDELMGNEEFTRLWSIGEWASTAFTASS